MIAEGETRQTIAFILPPIPALTIEMAAKRNSARLRC
jgi:hypothetical protein